MKDFIIDLAIKHPRLYALTAPLLNALDSMIRRLQCAKRGHRYGRTTCINCGRSI